LDLALGHGHYQTEFWTPPPPAVDPDAVEDKGRSASKAKGKVKGKGKVKELEPEPEKEPVREDKEDGYDSWVEEEEEPSPYY